LENFLSREFSYDKKAEEWFHARGIVGGDCHHWDFGRFAFACGASGSRGGTPNAVLEQLKASRIGTAQLPRHVQEFFDEALPILGAR